MGGEKFRAVLVGWIYRAKIMGKFRTLKIVGVRHPRMQMKSYWISVTCMDWSMARVG